MPVSYRYGGSGSYLKISEGYLVKILARIIIFSVFFSVFSPHIYCQQSLADSLVRILPGLADNKKVDMFSHLADIYNYIDNRTAIDYAQKGLELARQINYPRGLAACYGSLGHCYISVDNAKAIEYTQNALRIRRELNDRPGIATSLNVMGLVYYFTGNYLKAVEYHLQSMKIREAIGDDDKTMSSYNNIALVHMAMGNYETALYYLNKSLAMTKKLGKFSRTGLIYDNIGNIYSSLGEYDKALGFLFKGLNITRKLGYKKSEANSCVSIAVTYKRLNDTSNAFKYYWSALDIFTRITEKNGMSNAENGLAALYMNAGSYREAIKHALAAYELAASINSLENISRAANVLQAGYKKTGDIRNALRFLEIHHTANDSLQNIEKVKKVAKQEFDYRYEKIRKEQETELSRQNTFIIFLTLLLCMLIIIIFMFIRGYLNKKKMSERLGELNTKLRASNYAKDRFFSIIAHDLRGPFQSLLGLSDLLRSESETLSREEIKNYSSSLYQSLNRQYQLLDDLLNWSRVQNSSFKLELESVWLHKEIDGVIDTLAFTASQKSVQICNITDDKLKVIADKNMLRLVLRNLISNSIKFSNDDSRVEIFSAVKDRSIEITVADNGVGIAPSDIDKLFRPDILHSTKGTKNEKGSGLGLLLCKEIIEKHSGSIHVESRQSQGSRFIFTLPS